MKRIAGILIVAMAMALMVPALFAQNEERGEFSVFADYTRLHNLGGGTNGANFWGPGALISFNMGKYAALEGSMAYDLERTFTTTNTSVTNLNTTTTTTRNGLRLIHGLFGPKFQTALGPARVYGVLKGGFLDFQVSNQGTGTGFVSGINNFPHGDINGVFYPGVGVEFGKRFGIRAEIGDMMYFDNGANHNFKFMIGPKISF